MLLWATVAIVQESTSEQYQKEIDAQVWVPFAKAIAENDAKTFNSLHTDDVMGISSRGLLTGQQYKDRNTQMYNAGKKEGTQSNY